MFWLHHLLNPRRQLSAYLVQVHFIADNCTKCSDRAGCVILATVEATVYERMRAIVQWLEQKPYQKRGSDNRQLVSPYEGETACNVLEREHADFVDHSQHNRQGAIDQRAVNDEINVIEPVAQNGKANGERDQEEGDGEDDTPHFIKQNRVDSVDEGWDEFGYEGYDE